MGAHFCVSIVLKVLMAYLTMIRHRNLLFALTDGGTGGLFWGFTVTIIACIFIYLSVAEMASM